jgi:quercetin dioxygenase-like cupin family protein
MKHWTTNEILTPSADGRFRRMLERTPSFRVATLSFAAGDTVQEHSHPQSEELFYIVSGTARFVVEGRAVDASPGDLIHVTSAERHAIVVDQAALEPLVMLAVVMPDLGDDAVLSDRPSPVPPFS